MSGDNDPKQRLLKAGEEIFSLVGYRQATIRQISQRANVNVAMVTYYFGGKEELYREVLERSLRESVDRYVAASRPPDNASPEERLHGFVLALLSHALDEGGLPEVRTGGNEAARRAHHSVFARRVARVPTAEPRQMTLSAADLTARLRPSRRCECESPHPLD